MKMPTTTNIKVEAKPSTELGDAARQCLNCLEKKVRNLEKRKGRIEVNQEKARKGTKLEKEQENSLQQYEQVTHDLEFARELTKQFEQIIHEHEKMMKKQAKREKAERQALEIKRISEILQLQTLLDSLGGDKVREDFKTGKHGAVVLTEDNLSQLDKLYQAISPSRDDSGDEYPQRLTLAAEHLVSILEGKDRLVVGTTYKEIKELITLINECGYFERARKAQTEDVVEEPAQDTKQFEDTTELPDEEDEITTDDYNLNGEQQPIDVTITTNDGHHTNQDLPTDPLSTLEQDAFFAPSSQPYETEIDPQYAQPPHTAAAPRIPDFQSFTDNRPFQFIQASYVMPESAAPGIVDPAVIVAQPAVGSGLQFMSQGFDPVPQVTLQQPSQQPTSATGVTDLTQQTQSSVVQQPQAPQQMTPEYSSQSYSQPVLQQNIQPEGLFSVQAVTEVPSALTAHASIMGQIEDVSSYEIPPSIPMPPSQQEQTIEQQQQQQVQEKKFQMNASAPVFQSMYAQATTPVNSTQPPSLSPLADTQAPPAAADFSGTPTPSGDYGQTNNGDFQQSYHTNNGFSGVAYPRGGRGGFRGGRGANGGNGGNRSVAPAGSPLQNGFNGRGGGSTNTNNSRGGRGGTYPAYPPNYRPDTFQGNFNASGFAGGVYQKRGGLSNASNPASTGYARGGTGANAGRGAGIRGGVARGVGGGGGAPRGAPRGGYNRPMPA